MRPLKFWSLYVALTAAGTLGYCHIARAEAQAKPQPQAKHPIVKLGTPYRAERRKSVPSKPLFPKPSPPKPRKAQNKAQSKG